MSTISRVCVWLTVVNIASAAFAIGVCGVIGIAKEHGTLFPEPELANVSVREVMRQACSHGACLMAGIMSVAYLLHGAPGKDKTREPAGLMIVMGVLAIWQWLP